MITFAPKCDLNMNLAKSFQNVIDEGKRSTECRCLFINIEREMLKQRERIFK